MLKRLFVVLFCILLSGVYGREVVFIGLSGDGAPAIEKSFTRLLQEQFAVMPDVHAVDDIELQRLRARIENYSYPHLTSPLLAALNRFAPDSSLVIWGMIKECTVKPVRHLFIKAALSGSLTIELALYNLADRAYVYIGDAKAATEVAKGFVFWEPVEESVQISSIERDQIFNDLELKAASASGRIIQSLVAHEKKQHNYVTNRYAQIPGIEKKAVSLLSDSTSDSSASALIKPPSVAATPPSLPSAASPKTATTSAPSLFSPAGTSPDSAAGLQHLPSASNSGTVDSVAAHAPGN
jgi:hypothetical protein